MVPLAVLELLLRPRPTPRSTTAVFCHTNWKRKKSGWSSEHTKLWQQFSLEKLFPCPKNSACEEPASISGSSSFGATMVFEQLSEGIPTACTTIEEVKPGAN